MSARSLMCDDNSDPDRSHARRARARQRDVVARSSACSRPATAARPRSFSRSTATSTCTSQSRSSSAVARRTRRSRSCSSSPRQDLGRSRILRLDPRLRRDTSLKASASRPQLPRRVRGRPRRSCAPACASAAARSRAAWPCVSWPGSRRHCQFAAPISPGRFMRASLPRPSTSCTGTIASAHRDESARSRRGHDVLLAREAGERVGVVGRGVDDLVDAVVLESVRVVGRAAESDQTQHDHAREPERVAELADVRRDHAEVLGNHRQRPERLLGGTEERPARPRRPPAVPRALRVCGNRPVPGEPAEVVDTEEVDEVEHAAHPLDPPAVARRAPSPASRRAGCPRAGRGR